ncbi:MAG TPA: hypothetical protein VET48_10260, partial [Steroidobacteraceae bacterium]|nr:hypothetical protein [Steroidobacteraceae bacterium]
MNTQEAKALLPWYAAGALDVNEAREVEAALREDPSLERELKEFRALHASVQSVADDEPAFRPALLDEAHRRIDAYQRTHKSTPDKNFFAAVNASLGSTLEKLFGVWTGMPTYARVAVAGQFAVIAVLGVLLAIRTPEKVFDTAKGPNEGTNAHAVITVAFQP